MTFRDDLIKDHLEHLNSEKQSTPPPQYALVLHMNPDAYDGILHVDVMHVMVHHLSVPRDDTTMIILNASRESKAVIRSVTKDIGETLVNEVNKCSFADSPDFKISLEIL